MPGPWHEALFNVSLLLGCGSTHAGCLLACPPYPHCARVGSRMLGTGVPAAHAWRGCRRAVVAPSSRLQRNMRARHPPLSPPTPSSEAVIASPACHLQLQWVGSAAPCQVARWSSWMAARRLVRTAEQPQLAPHLSTCATCWSSRNVNCSCKNALAGILEQCLHYIGGEGSAELLAGCRQAGWRQAAAAARPSKPSRA